MPPLLTPEFTDNISPSIDGPLCSVKKMAQSGKFGPGVGGKARVHGHMLATKGSDGQTGNVPVGTNHHSPHRSSTWLSVDKQTETDMERFGSSLSQSSCPSRA
jgi:hypothetical protein